MIQSKTMKVKAHVWGNTSWFIPDNVSFKAMPIAFTLITWKKKIWTKYDNWVYHDQLVKKYTQLMIHTDNEPTSEQTPM